MKKIAIIGAGISGLYIANLFKDHKNYKVTIYEKRNSIEMDEGYGIQLSVNSVKLLNKIGFTSLTEEEKFNPKKIDFYEIKKYFKNYWNSSYSIGIINYFPTNFFCGNYRRQCFK